MKEQLANIRSQALAAIEGAADPAALDALRVQYLGKKGELTNVLKSMGSLSAEERPAMGQLPTRSGPLWKGPLRQPPGSWKSRPWSRSSGTRRLM